jgi:peptidoglycan/LPS O-acetylase OafA/YrhL
MPAGSRQYRADIEGLRAVAVLPVVAYHVAPWALPGGFVGVDIFFVISGFLITRLLLDDIDSGRFSLAAFYERRIRRILPALIAMLVVTFALGLRYCMPDELTDLSKSLIAATLSVSNFYFYNTRCRVFGSSAPAACSPWGSRHASLAQRPGPSSQRWG